jgi:hypothetical protein
MVLVEETQSTNLYEKQISLYLIKIDDHEKQFNDLKQLLDYFKYKTVNFAIVDVEEENLKKFNDTPLAKLLYDYNIPYHATYVANHTKKYFSKVILKKEEQIKRFLNEYQGLEDYDCPQGRSLKFWIDLYTKELVENRDFLNLKIKPQYLAKTILKQIDDCEEEKITFLYLGMESTFPELRKIFKDVNPNMDISYLHYLC